VADASFTIDIGTSGGSAVDAAAKSVDALAAKLEASSAATRAATDDVKAGEAAYRQAEATLDRAEKAIEKIGIAADAQRGKLKQAADVGDTAAAEKAAAKIQALTQRQAEAQQRAAQAKASLDAEATALDKLKASADSAAAEEAKLSKAVADAEKNLEKEKDAAKEAAGTGSDLAIERGLGRLPGPLASAGRSVLSLKTGYDKLQSALGDKAGVAVAAVGVAALVAVIIALDAAIVAGIVHIGEWAVGLADAARTSELLAQGITQDVKAGTALNDKINSLTKTLPLTREEISQTAKKLHDAGLQGKDLTDALESSAIQAAKLKFGPDFEREMLSLDEQSKVFKANLAQTFGGLRIDGLLAGLQKLIGLFDANTASGHAMKVVFESIFQPLIDGVAGSATKIEGFFLQLEIWTLKALIAIKPYGSTILMVIKWLGIAAAVVVGIVVVAFAAFVAIGVALFAAQLAVIGVLVWLQVELYKLGAAVIEGAVKGFGWLKDKALEVFNWLKSFSLFQMGLDLITGLVNGIKGAAGAVVDSVKGAVTGAVDAAKKALGISSPSKVFAEIGLQTGAGMEQGVDRSSDGVQGALESMTAPPATAAPGGGGGAPAPAARASGGKGGSAGAMNLQGAVFNFYGVEGAEDAEARFSAALTRLLEGDVAQLGAAKPA
jgi:hypothetical protein